VEFPELPDFPPTRPPDAVVRAILAAKPVIAIVGASSNPARPSHGVMAGLLDAGYDVIPVNPAEGAILGRTCYPDLASIPRRVDVVDVFRRREHLAGVAREAVAVKARVLWLQLGLSDAEAERIGREGGLAVISDRCTWVEHQRLVG